MSRKLYLPARAGTGARGRPQRWPRRTWRPPSPSRPGPAGCSPSPARPARPARSAPGRPRPRPFPIHKTPGGGWAQLQHQRSTEEAWEDNASELATQVSDAAERIGAAQIVVAGDARARSLLLKHLSTRWQAAVLMVAEEVPPDAGSLAEAAEQALARQEDQACRDRFGHWRTQLAHGAATQGLTSTLTALADGQVAQLFLAGHPATAGPAWVGPAATDLAATEAQLRERGVPEPACDRVDAAAIRAAAGTGAELYILPEDLIPARRPDAVTGPQDGICATLRYPPAG